MKSGSEFLTKSPLQKTLVVVVLQKHEPSNDDVAKPYDATKTTGLRAVLRRPETRDMRWLVMHQKGSLAT